MLLFVLHELWSIIDDSGSVVSSVVPSHPALLSFHMLAGNLDRAPVDGNRKSTLRKTPKTFRESTMLFLVLGTLRVDGRRCAPETPLEVVNSIAVGESVWKGGKIVFERDDGAKSEKATVALILWTRGKVERPAVAELSFRIKDSEERFSRSLAEAARSVYTLLLRLDCARREGMTKTEYIYRDATQD